jgi:GntR family transcriptional regulator, vanillate catabolism transcriptional regulator
VVLSGELPPGTRLIQEDVAARLSVSRTPLREAIRVLVYEGLLRPVPGGSSVEVVELDARESRELYEVREYVDGLAARLCARDGLSDAAVKTLEEALAEIRKEPFATERFNPAHLKFHSTIVEASGNRRLRQLMFIVDMTAQMIFPRLETGPERMRESAEEHQLILDAILARDPDLAEKRAREHIQAATEYWITQEGQAADASAT